MKILAIAALLLALVPATATASHEACASSPTIVDAGGAALVYAYDQPECTGAVVSAGDALCGATSFHSDLSLGAATLSVFVAPGGSVHACGAGVLLLA